MNLEDAEDRERALAVACRWCEVPAGVVCVRRHDGLPLANAAAHPWRIQDAGVVHAPIDSRELRADPDRRPRRFPAPTSRRTP